MSHHILFGKRSDIKPKMTTRRLAAVTVLLLMSRTASATAECATCEESELADYLGENTGAFCSILSHFGADLDLDAGTKLVLGTQSSSSTHPRYY